MVAADARTAITLSLSPGHNHDALEGRELLRMLKPLHSTYRRRNEIERLFRRLKGFKRIFSRFDKLAVMFTAFIHFALIVEALI